MHGKTPGSWIVQVCSEHGKRSRRLESLHDTIPHDMTTCKISNANDEVVTYRMSFFSACATRRMKKNALHGCVGC